MPVQLICETCGKPYSTPPSRHTTGRMSRFCSRACSHVAKRHPFPIDHFWSRVEQSADGCWLWRGVQNNGYGRYANRYAHRIVWELFNGPIPTGQFVCHHCDTPLCVRPDHLFLGTAADNAADRDAKKRGHRGERTGGHRLTERQIRDIRALLVQGVLSRRAIARAYSVSRTAVDDIANGRTWAHVV